MCVCVFVCVCEYVCVCVYDFRNDNAATQEMKYICAMYVGCDCDIPDKRRLGGLTTLHNDLL